MLEKIKAYIDAKVADAVRQQAWLKLSWNYKGQHEADQLRIAEKQLMELIDREQLHGAERD